ncbi:MAG: tetratricopeptide repeat protein [Chromatiales bacterium]|jgi:tetratricopeptide (TPR) repeat protein
MQVHKILKLVTPMLAGCLLLLGCTGNPARTDAPVAPAPGADTTELPFAEPEAPAKELDADILYHYLVAEVAAQRGQLELAYNHYLYASLLAGDAYAAKRATQIASFLKDQDAALKAARRWVSVAPNSIQARNSAAVLSMRSGNQEAAREHLLAMVKIAEAKGQQGFLLAAVALAKEKDRTMSRELMQYLTEQYSDEAQVYYAQAILFAAYKEYDQSLGSLEQALLLSPDWAKPKLLKAKILIDTQGAEQAVAYLEKVLQQHAEDRELRLTYAKLLAASDYQKAYREFEVLYQQDPGDIDVIQALGVLAVQLEDLTAARSWWTLLLNQGDSQKRSEAAFHLGQVEEMGGNKKSAIGYYEKVDKGIYKIDARLRLARLQAQLGDIAKARDLLQQLRVLEPERSVDFYLSEAQILQDSVGVDEVMAFYQSALDARPGDLELLYARAIFAADHDLIDIAEKDLRQVIEAEPDNADALNALGYTLADKTERYQDALELIEKALALKPDNPAILDSMGWVNYRLGKFDEALGFLKRALALRDDDEIAAHLGEVMWMMGDHDSARRVWQKALTTFPDSAHLADVLSRFK